MSELVEHAFDCPCCGAPITMLLDLSVEDQAYVEDCEVCCNPLVVRVQARDGRLEAFEATPES